MEETSVIMLGLGEVVAIATTAGISFLFYGITKEFAKESAQKGAHSLWDKVVIYGRSVFVSAIFCAGLGATTDKPMVIANIWALFIISSLAALAGGSDGMRRGMGGK